MKLKWLNRLSKLKHSFCRRPLIFFLLFSLIPGTLFSFAEGFPYIFIFWLMGIFLLLPICLTLGNLFFLFFPRRDPDLLHGEKQIEFSSIFLGILFFLLFLKVSNIRFADWREQLYNQELHTFILTSFLPTVLTICLLSLLGYFLLRLIPLEKLPPLPAVFLIASMYLGAAEAVVFIVQCSGGTQPFLYRLYFCLFPANYLVVIFKTVRHLAVQWNKLYQGARYHGKTLSSRSPFPSLKRLLSNSLQWPWMALILSLPLLGILILFLTLFGQEPDSIVKAWTETSDWRLSQHTGPQNIIRDEHYLCTVAAGGHKKVVKPLRFGIRHGHRVIVNRQLCVANAFEQLLEEKTPKFHRRVRDFYDAYGYPIAQRIHSPFAADIIYFLMKPAEWGFLFILYLLDKKPENRISLQYLPKQK